MDSSQKAPDKHARETVRRPYTKPQLQVYGDLRALTNTVGATGAKDGSPTANMQTSP